MRVGVVMEKIIRHRLRHGRWDLGAARSVEIRDRPTPMHTLERRKMLP
jgi:hypothetical protein